MHRRRPTSRPLLPALWLGIAALVLQAFGAAIHAHTHHGHPHPAALAAIEHVHTDAAHPHCHEHADHVEHDHSHPRSSGHQSRKTAPADPVPQPDHEECPTCLKVLANARAAFAAEAVPFFIAAAAREPRTLGAERPRSEAPTRPHAARGPPRVPPFIA